MAFIRSILSTLQAQISRRPKDVDTWTGFDLKTDANLLFRRDECSDAFGPDRFNSICSPSNTLCCVQKGEVFPSCQQEMGMGWCCVGNGTDQDCYVDQPSVCDSANSVACVDLAPDTTSACCPRLTRCSSGYQAAEGNVRCEIGYADLMQLVATASQTTALPTTSSTSSVSSTSSISSTPSSPAASGTSTGTDVPVQSQNDDAEPQQAGHMSSGAIAGIAVGAVGFVILVALALYFLRRKRKTKEGDNNDNSSSNVNNNNVYMDDQSRYYSHLWQYNTETQGPRYPSELASMERPKELSPDRPLGELPG